MRHTEANKIYSCVHPDGLPIASFDAKTLMHYQRTYLGDLKDDDPQGGVKKKEYSVHDLKTVNSLKNIYEKFFSKNNCQSLLSLLNRFSVADAILNSGGTSIIVEYKNRNLFVYEFETTILEVEKYQSLKKSSQLFAAPCFYIVEFTDAVLVYQLDFDKEPVLDYISLPVTNKSGERIMKPVIHLSIEGGDYIIGKRTWARASKQQLLKYVERMRNG